MITYSTWKIWIDEFTIFTENFEKISSYTFLTFISIITIPLDILFLPFEIIGIIIFLITKYIDKRNRR